MLEVGIKYTIKGKDREFFWVNDNGDIVTQGCDERHVAKALANDNYTKAKRAVKRKFYLVVSDKLEDNGKISTFGNDFTDEFPTYVPTGTRIIAHEFDVLIK